MISMPFLGTDLLSEHLAITSTNVVSRIWKIFIFFTMLLLHIQPRGQAESYAFYAVKTEAMPDTIIPGSIGINREKSEKY